MARIKDEDVVTVRERARIDEVIREVVTLKSAGGGSLKGLCPFHDERSPSFHVTPAKGFFHCFGCEAGGDVIDFVRKYDHLDFSEAVEKLAGRVGISLRYEEGSAAPDRQRGQRVRLVEAHRAAADFYAEQLRSPAAQVGRDFLKERDFDQDAAEKFGIGFAPEGWDHLTGQLRSAGFTDQELTVGGLAVSGQRGAYDRFRGRLVWPIRDLSGDVIGFGARKLLESDQGPKYLNTPETPLYKKSQVLYGVDMARREISKQQRAVVVEGYTDVMAAHLSGVQTAVATCGTAFGLDHIKILRRLLMDQDEFRGEVIFTFDGDAAGRKAALRAFDDDQRFVAQTYVAVEVNGLDPCELRQQQGPEAVRELVARRVPLFQFAIRAVISDHDLETAEGRVAALRATAPLLAGIKDRALRPEYSRLVAGWIGIEQSAVTDEVRRATAKGSGKPVNGARGARAGTAPTRSPTQSTPGSEAAKWERPDQGNPVVSAEREALKCALQIPLHVDSWYATVEGPAYTAKIHGAVHDSIAAAGLPGSIVDGHDWIEAVLKQCPDDELRAFIRELALDPLHTINDDDDEALRVYGSAVVARILEMDATRRTVELKNRLQRTNPTENTQVYNQMFAELLELEHVRRQLREQALGGLMVDETTQ